MNVLECQSVGTPVITTNYTAMADFTKVGIAVPHRQMVRTPGAIYDLALPDVQGIADALREMHGSHLAMKRGDQSAMIGRQADVTEFNAWVDRTMSPRSVGERFEALFARAELEFESRIAGRLAFKSGKPPTANAVKVVTGYHTPVADWDEPWTLLAPDGLRLTNVGALNSIAWSLRKCPRLCMCVSSSPLTCIIETIQCSTTGRRRRWSASCRRGTQTTGRTCRRWSMAGGR